jgi:hypothetical protein
MKLPVQQGTPEWFAARMGMATASAWKKAMTGAKEWSDTAMGYAMQIAAERIGGVDDDVQTAAMARGSALEGEALDLYEEETFVVVQRGTFHVHDSLPLACSPDAEILGDRYGIVEVKCMKVSKHAAVWHAGECPDEHMVQVQFNLWLTGADYCDFVSYHDGVPKHLQLCVVRVERSEEMILSIESRAKRFLQLVDSISAKLGADLWQPWHITNIQDNVVQGPVS